MPRLLFISNLFPTMSEPYRGLDNATLLRALTPEFEIRALSPRPALPWARPRFSPRAEDARLRPAWIRAAYVPKIGSRVNHLLMAASLADGRCSYCLITVLRRLCVMLSRITWLLKRSNAAGTGW